MQGISNTLSKQHNSAEIALVPRISSIIKIALRMVAVSFLLVVNLSALANSNDISIGTKTVIQSEVLGEERELWIYLPENYDESKKYPVLYLLDGKRNFSHTVGTMSFLESGGRVPESIIVGISNKNRLRDFTPTKVKNRSSSGGGEKFLDFIEEELIPFIDKKYSSENFKIFAGHSLGGLLVLHSLHARPHLFQAHFAYSPSLYWDNKTTVNRTIDYLAKTKQFKNYLYMNIGNEGLQSDHPNGLAMRSAFQELDAKLKNNKPNNFLYKLDSFDGETHGTTPVIGHFNAIRDLYEPWFIPFEPIKIGLTAIEQYYQMLSERYDYQIKPHKNIIIEAGDYHLSTTKNIKEAIALFKANTINFPTCANCYAQLARTYEKNGDLNNAIEQINYALKHTNKFEPQFLAFTEDKRRLLEMKKSQGN